MSSSITKSIDRERDRRPSATNVPHSPSSPPMLGNESNASRRSLNGANSADALPELLAGAGSGGRTRKRRLEEDGDAADPQALDNAIRAVESVYKDLESHSRGPTGIVGFTGATDLVNQLQDSVSSLALLWKPSPENDTRLDDIDAIASGIWNLSINSKVDNEVPGHSTAKQLVAECERDPPLSGAFPPQNHPNLPSTCLRFTFRFSALSGVHAH